MLTSFQSSFSAGEISPSLFGRIDLNKWKQGAFTYRNMFANYRGGASSRAGTAYIGMCKQGSPNNGGTATNNPPRDIPFQFNINQGYALEFGDEYMRIKSDGAYVTEAPQSITGITQANPGVITYNNGTYTLATGDWVFFANVGGTKQLNNQTYIWQALTSTTGTLTDLFGNVVNTFIYGAFTSGGTLARIYTLVTPYAAIDLPFLKYAQSADNMTLCCVNQITGTEYPSYELLRMGSTTWTITADTFGTSITAPTNVASSAQSSTTVNTWYSYVVTAVAADGEESIASTATAIENNDIAIYAGSNTITWKAVAGATSYNIYAATPSYTTPVPVGVLYGYLGTSYGGSFVDTNIVADMTTVPPTHQNPFAVGAITSVTPTVVGSGYSQGTVGYTITTGTGSGAVIVPIVVGGSVVAYIVVNGGKGYLPADTISITGGSSATASLVVGPETGTYPSTAAYFQQRRVYANTQNNPDTYFMSQPGAFSNMDSSIPTVDSDAIIGTPWAQQINGIQFMVPMPGGLVIFTGAGIWQLVGSPGPAITPSDQDATPQAYNGCHFHVQPIPINYDILFVQSKGSIIRDLQYNFFVNIYTSSDQTVLANQLFTNHQIEQWAYAEEPNKLIWVVRDDGILLGFTYLKEQDVYAWTRHDTNGLFQGVCSISEPPSGQTNVYVDAVYLIVQRLVRGQWVYYSERMNNRIWDNVEETWCVDCGLSFPMNIPSATLTPVSANGTSNISNTNLVFGGAGYTAPTATAFDPTNVGSGATFSVTQVGGVITAVTPLTQGTKYPPGLTKIIINDPTGSGAVVYPIITNDVVFNASASVFTSANVGDVIRIGGGKATVVSYVTAEQVIANITQPITDIITDDINNTPVPAAQGQWTITTPTNVVTGLSQLEGLTVSILADGSVVNSQIVVDGTINLPAYYSQILVGLPFISQLQTPYLDVPDQGGSMQAKRVNIQGLSIRVEKSRGFTVGSNQPDASTQPNYADVPWEGMKPINERSAFINAGSAIPLFTGNIPRQLIPGEWIVGAQMAFEQKNPLPMTILSCSGFYTVGDTSSP
jgi:hypothetical protein